MDALLFDQTLKNIEFIFRFSGISMIRCTAAKASERFKFKCLFILNFICANVGLLGSISWCIDSALTGKDYSGLIFSAPCINVSILAQCKGIFLIVNSKSVNKLIDKLRQLEIKQKTRKQSSVKAETVKKELTFLNYVLKTLNMLYVSLIVTFAMSPLLLTAVKYYQTKEIELELPFLILYPIDPFQMKVYPFVYLQLVWSECVVSLDICSADYFFFTCCTYIRIQFRLLQHDLENLIPVVNNSNQKFVENEEFQNNFKELIKWHHDLIESANTLEIIYSKSTLLNFLSSSLIICLTGFNVTMVNDAAFVVTFLSFLFMSLVQVFFLCFFADLLMTSSMEIGNAVYNSKWYTAEAKVAKKLLLIQTRSLEPCKLTASGFADVSLNSFMRVLSTAWSYFALLQTMYGN